MKTVKQRSIELEEINKGNPHGGTGTGPLSSSTYVFIFFIIVGGGGGTFYILMKHLQEGGGGGLATQ